MIQQDCCSPPHLLGDDIHVQKIDEQVWLVVGVAGGVAGGLLLVCCCDPDCTS